MTNRYSQLRQRRARETAELPAVPADPARPCAAGGETSSTRRRRARRPQTPGRLQRWLRRRRGGLLLLALLGAGALLTAGRMHARVAGAGRNRIYAAAEAPPHRVAIVFGARVYADGRPSFPLRQRLAAALTLYRNGRVRRILVSGDNRVRGYNEPAAMRAWLLARGVAPADVGCDYAGFRTLDTCARARHVWGLRRAILVSQRYHLPRALFLAKVWGLEAAGVRADAPGAPTPRRAAVREPLARILAWLDARILNRQPRFFGPPERL